ncbi:pheromone A receptor-domain-containing protein [Hypomontagnella monticulosa]|nr:pheromone A receptor-domain-containing protein [Hypomontagnella monticulosa]
MATVVDVVAAATTMAIVATASPIHETSVAVDRKTQLNPGLMANMIFRVLLAIIGTSLCWVPFRLLRRNGDFAAVVLIAVVAIMNLFTVVNSLIWRNDDWDHWWDGVGLCDVEVYLMTPLETVYAAAIFSIVRQVSNHLKLESVAPPDRKKRAIAQAGVIFTFPIIQLGFTWFDLSSRYAIGTLVGCVVTFDNSWPKFLFYDSPAPLFVLGCVPYAILTCHRYRKIAKATQEALRDNRIASARANRTRIRLYNMSLSILTAYFPVSIYLFVWNIQTTLKQEYKPYSYLRIHWEAEPYPWSAILFMPSWYMSTLLMNQPWIAIATTVPIIGFFGTTKDARAMYRRHALALGLGWCFTRLRGPVGPDGGRGRLGPRDDSHHTWIELESRGNRDRERIMNTGRHADPYPIPHSAGTTNFDPEALLPLSHIRSPPLEPQPSRRLGSPPIRFPPFEPIPRTLSTIANVSGASSPLERAVISSVIPERNSSLQHLAHVTALRAPASTLPRVSVMPFPTLRVAINRRFSRAGDSVRASISNVTNTNTNTNTAGPSTSHSHSHARTPSQASDAALTTTLRTPERAMLRGDSSPVEATPESQFSRGGIQPRSWLAPSEWSVASVEGSPANWPFLAGTALTTSTASAVRPDEPVNTIPPADSPVRSTAVGYVRVPIVGGGERAFGSPRAGISSGPSGDVEAQREGRRVPRSVVARMQRAGVRRVTE